MANKVRGEIGFKALGKSWVLKLGVNAMCEIESETGKSISAIGAAIVDEKQATMSLMRTVFWGALQEHHDGLSIKETGSIIDAIGMNDAGRLIGEAFTAANPEPKGGDTRPPKGTAA
ncbi:MAG: hypothetical protein ACRECY_20305 [Phyllobacterium sp.]